MNMHTLNYRQKIRVIFYGKRNVSVFCTVGTYHEMLDSQSANAVTQALNRIAEDPTCKAIAYTTWDDITLQVDLI